MRGPKIKQAGFTLYMVLVLMAIIAILVMAGGQMLNTEMRISSNDADRKFAFSLAEDTLKAGEVYALTKVHREKVLNNPAIKVTLQNGSNDIAPYFDIFKDNTFTEDCVNGLCLPAMEKKVDVPNELAKQGSYSAIPAWERKVDNESVIDVNGISYAQNLDGIQKTPKYIIEFLGPSENSTTSLYRITARAWGRNPSTQVTLQSVINAENKL